MHTGAINSYFDVAQMTLYAFWIFFAFLVLYIRREDKREGYPVVSDLPGRVQLEESGMLPAPQQRLMVDGSVNLMPRPEPLEAEPNATPIAGFPGAALEPNGDPMLAGVGPGAWVNRADVPDVMYGTSVPRIVPLRADHEYSLAPEDPDPRGMPVTGVDGEVAGSCIDAWVDRADCILRYLEVELTGGQVVLVPVNFTTIGGNPKRIRVKSILSTQFVNVPVLSRPEQITRLEEDKICAYYGGGTLYATPERAEPLL